MKPNSFSRPTPVAPEGADSGEPEMWEHPYDVCLIPPASLFAMAMAFTGEVHLYSPRKVEPSSYMSHLLLTSGFISKNLGTIRACTIGLLHDVVEEGSPEAQVQLQRRFPKDIYLAVLQMSPVGNDSCLGWTERKTRAIARMANVVDADIAMAFAGDKAATVFELVQDIRHKSSQHVLSRMGRTADQLLWYYGTAQYMLSRRVTESMADFFASQVSDLRSALRVN